MKHSHSIGSRKGKDEPHVGGQGALPIPADKRLLRILCLHGWRSNNDVSMTHVGHLQLKSRFLGGVDLLRGRVESPNPPDTGTMEFFDGPFYSWVETDTPDAADQLKEALNCVVQHVQKEGPYDCVYGFSQGGAIVTLLSMPEVLQSLGVAESALWRGAIIACGASEKLIDMARKLFDISIPPQSSKMPSMHIIGVDDIFKGSSEELLQLFSPTADNNPASHHLIRSIVYFSGGHGVSSSFNRDEYYLKELNSWLDSLPDFPSLGPEHSRHAGRSFPVSRVFSSNRRRSIQKTSTLRSHASRKSPGASLSVIDEMENGIDAAEKGALLHPNDKDYDNTRHGAFENFNALLSGASNLDRGLASFRYENEHLSIVTCNISFQSFQRSTIRELLRAAPTDSALLRSTEKSVTTYGDVLEFVESDGDLRKSGRINHPSQIVAYSVPSGSVGAVAFFAVSLQAIALPIDPEASYDDILSVMNRVKPTLAMAFRGITASEFEKAAEASGTPLFWQTIDTASGMYCPENPVDIDHNVSPLVTGPDDHVLLLRTSGSTGMSKIVPLNNKSLCLNAICLADSLELSPSDVALNAMPLFHIGGISASLLASAAAYASLICLPKFEPELFFDTVRIDKPGPKPTWFTAVPTMHLSLLMYGSQTFGKKAPKHNLRFLRTGAAAISQEDAIKVSKFWQVNLVSTYSMTEQMPISSKPISLKTKQYPSTVGQLVCTSLAIVDGATLRPVPWGQQGELCISGASVMEGYLNDVGNNVKSFFWIGNRRFFRTGDIGKLDNEAFIYLVGRSKEMIKVGGEQVSPIEVETVVKQHPYVAVAVVFAVPSITWGEEVGAAIVLNTNNLDAGKLDLLHADDKSKNELEGQLLSEIKKWVQKKLGARKSPWHWKVVHEEELPKTASGKYIRTGLAEKLGVQVEDMNIKTAAEIRQPSRISNGLSGLRYVMAVGVMFNHISAVWQGEDERNPLTFGPAFVAGKASTFYFPATVFFVLGGFTLSAALSTRPIKRGGWSSFYGSRFQGLMPLYLFAVLLGLINLLITCRPSTYSSEFSWQPNSFSRELSDGSMASCQTGPIEMPYGAWLFVTLLIFCLGLQAWFFAFLFCGWLLYYSWFFSVYFFIILIFPWMQNALASVRGKISKIWMWFAIYNVGVYASCGALAAYYALSPWKQTYDLEESKSWSFNFQNIYALSTTLFPPYWVPCVGSGIVAYFWYDFVRPAESHRWKLYGLVCDALSIFFFLFHLFMFIDIDWPYPTALVGKMWDSVPEEAHTWDSAIKRYVWSVLINRMFTPLIAIWIALLSMPGKSFTARFMEWSPLSMTLGATSYGCFLFHQIVCQWYWWFTRAWATQAAAVSVAGAEAVWQNPETPPPGALNHTVPMKDYTWWAFTKQYYWFSPLPLPVTWYEFLPVVGLTTLFAMFCNTYLNGPLTLLWINFWRFVRRMLGLVDSNDKETELSAEELVREAVTELTGDELAFDTSYFLEQQGVGSVSLPIFVSLLNSKDERLGLKVSDIAMMTDLNELVALVAERQEKAAHDTGVGNIAL